jgi:hypothetical protein
LGLEKELLDGFSAALGVPADATLAEYLRTGRGRAPGKGKLLAWDANSIHSFVFDTTNATGIRGASDVLRGIDENFRTGSILGLRQGQILFSGGGSGLAVVAEHEVEACRRKLHRVFATRTGIATCTEEVMDLTAGEGGFKERVVAVRRALERNRMLTGPDAEPAVPFFAARCAVCGRRAAAVVAPRRGAPAEGRLECQPCHDRIEQGKRNVHFQGEPTDFADIADGNGKGFYAVVYLDGNGIGRTISHLESPLDYASFSRAVDQTLRDSFQKIAERYGLLEDGGIGNDGRGKAKGGYQRPICGGDDVVAILPGDVAVPFTRDLLQQLETAADAEPRLQRAKFGVSAGVAIGHAKFPIRHLLAEAEGLLRLAKRRAYEPASPRSTLNFAVVTDGSPRSETLEPERWGRPAAALLLSGRPYTLPEMDELSRRFRAVLACKKVGRSQLYALHTHALRGPRQFRNHVLYQIGRREEWRQLAVDLGRGDERLLRDPDRCEKQFAPDYSGRQVFDIADMVELLGHWREPEERKES